jgi:hypothetical protein
MNRSKRSLTVLLQKDFQMTTNEIGNAESKQLNRSALEPLHRFRLMQGKVSKEGKFDRMKTVGMAYFQEGQNLYTLRLWTFSDARFYLLASKATASHYMLMTREPTRDPRSKNKYHWNIVGNAQVDAMAGVIRIQFDLLGEPIFMGLFPEVSAQMSRGLRALAGEEAFNEAA